MSAAERRGRGGVATRLLSSPVRAAYLGCVALFLWCVAQFYQPGTGFSSLLMIGDALNPKVSALRAVPHYVYADSAGYDGAYYVQLALHPTLDNPELATSIDNLPYRARRILFSWVSWLVGLGRPEWIVQVHALLNVACWLAFAGVSLRWFPPTSGQNFLRWAAVLFSHGWCMSVRDSLVDGPSLLLVAVTMRWLESGHRGRAAAMLALAGLGKETTLLAAAALVNPAADGGRAWRSPRWWGRAALTAVAVALPLVAWMGYVRWRCGPAGDPGLNNFTLPFAGLAEKWGGVVADFWDYPRRLSGAALAATLAITVQGGFFAFRRQIGNAWWRVGAAYAAMTVFLSTPVWEGYPGAFTRVLLPMTLAFNILVPRSRAWLPVLILGNLGVWAGLGEATPPARDFLRMGGEGALVAAVAVKPATAWYGPEESGGVRWRWTSGKGELRVENRSGHPVWLIVNGVASSALDERKLWIEVGEALVWSGDLRLREPVTFRFGRAIPPGETAIRFATDQPAHTIGADPRTLAVKIANLEVVVKPAAGSR